LRKFNLQPRNLGRRRKFDLGACVEKISADKNDAAEKNWRERPMSPRISPTLAVLLAASVALSLGADAAAAAKRDRHAAAAAYRVRGVQRWHDPPHVVRRQPMSDYDYNHPDESAGGPGYVFVPGRGILNESCNMPTSTCTNEYRDVQ
jgi:hypothetical protein